MVSQCKHLSVIEKEVVPISKKKKKNSVPIQVKYDMYFYFVCKTLLYFRLGFCQKNTTNMLASNLILAKKKKINIAIMALKVGFKTDQRVDGLKCSNDSYGKYFGQNHRSRLKIKFTSLIN